jgi:hypothetical protein
MLKSLGMMGCTALLLTVLPSLSFGQHRSAYSGVYRAGGGFYGGNYGRRSYYNYGPHYGGSSIYFGLGGWAYPYYGYYAYRPYYYYAYAPYAYNTYPLYRTPPAAIPHARQPMPWPQSQTRPQSLPTNSQGQAFYLLAFNDHSIEAASTYNVVGDRIHWVTRDYREKQAPLSNVDISYSQQLNFDRHVNFRIP